MIDVRMGDSLFLSAVDFFKKKINFCQHLFFLATPILQNRRLPDITAAYCLAWIETIVFRTHINTYIISI